MRRMICFFALGATLLCLSPLRAQPAAADPLKAVVTMERSRLPLDRDAVLDASLRDQLMAEYGSILAEQAKTLRGWNCVSLEPGRSPPVELSVLVNGPLFPEDDPVLGGDHAYSIRLTLKVRGQGSRTVGPLRIDMDDPEYKSEYSNPHLALVAIGGIWIKDLMGKFTPCAPKGRGKGSMKLRTGDASGEWKWEGDVELTLDGAGSFDVTGPMTATFNFSYPPLDDCTASLSAAYVDATLRLAGAYEDDDGSLHLTRVELKSSAATGQLTATCDGRTVMCTLDTRRTPLVDCPINQVPLSVSLPPLNGHAPGEDLVIALADGAKISIPLPPEVAGLGANWEMSLELSYGGEELPVGVTALLGDRPD